LDEFDIDLIFLDVEMPKMSGFEYLNQLKDVPPVIFISSKGEYAVEAFKFKAANFLKKPFSEQEFNKAISELIENKHKYASSKGIKDSFFVKDKGRLIQIFLNDILFIEALSDYVQINLENKKYTVLSSLKVLSKILPADNFYRVHRSFIVNKLKIKEIEDTIIVLGSSNVPLSRSHRQQFMDWIHIL
jgi:DNA-binding LytR/AlgR family response regulator